MRSAIANFAPRRWTAGLFAYRRVALVACVALCLACAGVGKPELEYDWSHDPKASFEGFSHYAWLPAPPLATPGIDSKLLEKRIREASKFCFNTATMLK